MADLFDYLMWRGDLTFSQSPANAVDGLIFSTLAYVHFTGLIQDDPLHPVYLHNAVDAFFASDAPQEKVRDQRELDLLLAAGQSRRFRDVGLCFYRDVFEPEAQTQFAAMTFLLDDGRAFAAFRGTDSTLTGWKEDFNMTFLDTVPAQLLAAAYIQELGEAFPGPLLLGGHSKGGNLAVFAGAKAPQALQTRIQTVYNLDGPGFREYLMGDPGYLSMVPKIATYIPQSSIIGMLLEHEEPYTVIRSRQVGLLQHDPYSWEVMATEFVVAEDLSRDNKFLDRTIKSWLSGMSNEERGAFVDTVYELLCTGGAVKTHQLLHPQNIRTMIKTLNADENLRRLIAGELVELIQSARATQQEMAHPPESLPEETQRP